MIIPNSITAIGEQAFVGGSGLTSIVIPNSVKSVNTSSFYGCSGLTSVIIPNSVTFIGDAAFYGCHGLGSVVISENMTSIGNNAFADCPKLTDVYCLAESVPSTKNRTFGDIVVSDVTLHVPAASVNAYKVADLWKYFKRIIAIGDDAILETPKCANPTITNNDGVVSFSCETEGVEFVSEIKSNDNRKEFDNKIFLNNTYTISVYATKPGFENSDIVTMEVVGTGGINGDLNGDGAVDVGDHVELTNIIMGKTK